MFVKTQFTIKDLENLSGVKAHTIRIWEKRYHLLNPNRTETNIRYYNLDNLKKLLNVSFLYNEGYKISKIAALEDTEMSKIIQEMEPETAEKHAIQAFKTAMFDFDYGAFSNAYRALSKNKSFDAIFFDAFLPLLNEIGNLWQTGTIDPAHERFISEIIKQKLIVEIHSLREHSPLDKAPKFALYLPYEEIHEIGLLYVNFALLSHGFNTIYLGNNIPMESLKHLLKHYHNLTFISYFTVKPDHETVTEYVKRFEKEILVNKSMELWILGSKTREIASEKLPQNISIIQNLSALKNKIEALKKS